MGETTGPTNLEHDELCPFCGRRIWWSDGREAEEFICANCALPVKFFGIVANHASQAALILQLRQRVEALEDTLRRIMVIGNDQAAIAAVALGLLLPPDE